VCSPIPELNWLKELDDQFRAWAKRFVDLDD
jgi:hypothetical protein